MPERLPERSRIKRSREQLWRRPASYRLHESQLIPVAIHPVEPAQGERSLYRQIAALTDAEPSIVIGFAEHHGPLGPIVLASPSLSGGSVGWWFGAMLGTVQEEAIELRRWVAYGANVPIPAHLTLTAHVILSLATAAEALGGRLDDLGDMSHAGIEAILLGAMGRYTERITEIEQHLQLGDQPVVIAPSEPISRAALARALAFLTKVAADVDGDGGSPSVFANSLNPLMTVARAVPSDAPLLGLNSIETLEMWHQAADEMATWCLVLPWLRGGRQADSADEARAVLQTLAGRAGQGQSADSRWPSRKAVSSPSQLRIELRSQLSLRLQQVGAWPSPRPGVFGTFARALWSLWPLVTDERPPRRCAYTGCRYMLSGDVHGATKYCPEHRREIDRARAARNRASRSDVAAEL